MSVGNANYGGESSIHVLVRTENEDIDWQNNIYLPGDWTVVEIESATGNYNLRIIYHGSIEYEEEVYDELFASFTDFLSEGWIESYDIQEGYKNVADQEKENQNLGLTRLYMPYRTIPKNATNAISFEDITEGQEMVNFHDEAAHGRYYTRESYNALKSRNPFTREVINPRNVKTYKAHFKGGKRMRTRRVKKSGSRSGKRYARRSTKKRTRRA